MTIIHQNQKQLYCQVCLHKRVNYNYTPKMLLSYSNERVTLELQECETDTHREREGYIKMYFKKIFEWSIRICKINIIIQLYLRYSMYHLIRLFICHSNWWKVRRKRSRHKSWLQLLNNLCITASFGPLKCLMFLNCCQLPDHQKFIKKQVSSEWLVLHM